MKKIALSLIGLALSSAAMPASAAVVFSSDFESVSGAPTPGNYSLVQNADGWSATDADHPIELQNNVAGAPASTGGSIFVELDSTRNSSMSRTIAATGNYALSFLYSPRPGRSLSDNGIEVLLNNVLLNPPGTVAAAGGNSTSWSPFTSNTFNAAAGSTLTFRAVGDDTSYGGYVDNITLTAVPEPATWGMMILGFGAVGGAMRGRRSAAKRAFA